MAILIVTDNPIFNIGLRAIIVSEFPDTIILETDTIRKSLSIAAGDEVQIMVLDAGVVDGKDRFLLDTFKNRNLDTAILVYIGDEFEYVYAFIRAGIHGIVSRKSDAVEIAEALFSVRRKVRFVSFDIQQMLLSHISDDQGRYKLTRKEKLIADLFIANKTNHDIATMAEINPKMVAYYKRRIFQKLQVGSVLELGVKLSLQNAERFNKPKS